MQLFCSLLSSEVLHAEAQAKMQASHPANFGPKKYCLRECICEVEGQVPCPSTTPLPKEMTGKYRAKMAETQDWEAEQLTFPSPLDIYLAVMAILKDICSSQKVQDRTDTWWSAPPFSPSLLTFINADVNIQLSMSHLCEIHVCLSYSWDKVLHSNILSLVHVSYGVKHA